MSNPHDPPEDDFALSDHSADPDRERDTLPPGADDDRDSAGLLASVAIQLDGVSRQLAAVARDLTVAVGQGKSHSKTLGDHDKRITDLESSVQELKQAVAALP